VTQRFVDRDFWQKAGDYGLLGSSIPEEYGGMGGGLAHDAVVFATLGKSGDSGFGLHVHNIAVHYILAFGTEEQKHCCG
jgi:acyl-CoA dehydrogenase